MKRACLLDAVVLRSVRLAGANLASKGSKRSILSFASVGSLLSAGSILSIGSAGSILSIGSVGSILSIGSAGYSPSRERDEEPQEES